MLRSLSVVLGASLLLTACGGGSSGGGSKSSSSDASSSAVSVSSSSSVVSSSSSSSSVAVSSSSSVVSSSVVSSSSVASSSSVSSSSSSSSGPAVIDLPVASWYSEKEAGFAGGVVSVTTQWQGAGYYLNLPVPSLEFATVEVTVAVDNAFKVSGSGLSLWAGVDAAVWAGKSDCAAVESSAFVEGVDIKVTCVLDSGGAFAQTAAPVKLGIQATGASPAGTFTIKSARIVQTTAEDFPASSSSAASESSVSSSVASSDASSSSSSAASSQARVEMAWDWYAEGAEGTSTVAWVDSNPSVAPTAEWSGAGWYLAAANVINLENATLNFVINVDAAFDASNANLHLEAIVDADPWTSKDCTIEATALVAGSDVPVSCVLDKAGFNQTSTAVKFKVLAVGATPAGSFVIKDRYIALP